MGKNKGNKRKNNGYFAKNKQQNGPNFLLKKTAKDIQFDLRNIVRDIAFSNPEIDIPDLTEYFLSYVFVQNLATAASIEFNKYNAEFIGLSQYLMMYKPDPTMQIAENMNIAQSKAAAYSIVLNHLNNIINLFNNGQGICGIDQDMWLRANIETILKSLSAQLKQFKRVL